MQGRAKRGEQRGGEERRPPPVAVPGRAPQQRGRAQHEHHRQDPRPGQATYVVSERAEWRVDHRGAGKVVRERRDRHAVQPVRPLQVPGPQVQGLILVRGVGPEQADRQQRLDDEYRQQRPPAGHTPPGGPVRAARLGPVAHQRARRGLHRRRELLPGCDRGDACLHGRSPPPPAHDVRDQNADQASRHTWGKVSGHGTLDAGVRISPAQNTLWIGRIAPMCEVRASRTSPATRKSQPGRNWRPACSTAPHPVATMTVPPCGRRDVGEATPCFRSRDVPAPPVQAARRKP